MAHLNTIASTLSRCWCILCFLLVQFVIPYASGLGYKKFLKGLLIGALLTKHNRGDDKHYYYPVYQTLPTYEDHGYDEHY